MAKFKKGDKVTLKSNKKLVGRSGNTSYTTPPLYGEIYTVDSIVRDCLCLKEIPFVQNGIGQLWYEGCFEKVVEGGAEKVEYRVVVVEIDKRVKEKREEVIFAN